MKKKIASFIVALSLVPIPCHPQADSTPPVKNEAYWRAVEKKLTKPRKGMTADEAKRQKRELMDLYRSGKLKAEPHQPPPSRQRPIPGILNDPKAQEELHRRVTLQHQDERGTDYDGKRVKISLVKKFDSADDLKSYALNQGITRGGKRVRVIKGNTRKDWKTQLLDARGTVFKEASLSPRELTPTERMEIKEIYTDKVRRGQTKGSPSIDQWVENTRVVIDFLEPQHGHLLERETYLRFKPGEEVRGERALLRTKIYDEAGRLLVKIDNEENIYVSPDLSFFVAKGRYLTFYDGMGDQFHRYELRSKDGPLIFSSNGEYVGFSSSITKQIILFDKRGRLLWEKRNDKNVLASIVAIANDGHILTAKGQWIDRSGDIIWTTKAVVSVRSGTVLLDEREGLLLTTRGVQNPRGGSGAILALAVVELHSGEVIEEIDHSNLSGYATEFLGKEHLSVVAMSFQTSGEKKGRAKALCLYRISYKK